MVLHAIGCFLSGLLLINAMPHFLCGVCGRPFPSPFSKPPGVGMSRPIVNVLWGWSNGVAGGALLLACSFHCGWNLGSICFAAAALAMGLMHAWHFGKVMTSRNEVE